MTTVHVGVRHDVDAMIAQLRHIEPALLRLTRPDAGAECGDQRPDLLTAEHAVEPGALDVQDLTLQRQNSLELAVPALFGAAAGAVALDDEDLGLGRIPLLTIRQLTRQAADIQHALTPGQFTGAAGSLTGAGRVHHLLDDLLGLTRMRLEPMAYGVRDGCLHHRLYLAADQLILGLAAEFRIRDFDRQHGRHTLPHILAL